MSNPGKLLARLMRDFPELNLTDKHSIVRIRRGRHGKAAGAWAWEVLKPDGCSASIGSEETMGECLKAPILGKWSPRYPGNCILIVAELKP